MEGPHAVTEALQSPRHTVDQVFVTPSAARRERALLRLAAAAEVAVTPVTERVLASLSDTVTPQGVVAVLRTLTADLEQALPAAPRLVVVLHDVADPGNAGTVIRTADAVGADAVVLTGDSVDPHNPKCVRATAGSLFHLPVVRVHGVDEALDRLRAAGLAVAATTLDDSADVTGLDADDDLAAPTAWVFGNEAHGLPDEVVEHADRRVRIPLYGAAESLNLAAAAAVCLYACARAQHR